MNSFKQVYKALLKKLILQPLMPELEDLFLPPLTRLQERIDVLKTENNVLKTKNAELATRLSRIEDRFLSYYRYRFDAIDRAADYLVPSELPGDYLEFGVYQGTLFSYAYKIFAMLFKQMRFIAFDSFQGLPKPRGLDAESGYTGGFHEGQFACTDEEFISNLTNEGVDLGRVVLIKGWFDQTLTEQTAHAHDIRKIAITYIDCDLYESTVPVLRFITPMLSVGSVLMFDDWRNFHNLSHFGQQRACAEWLNDNPQISLNALYPFAANGQAFTVSSC